MSITYNWSISQLDCDPNVQGEADYVVCIHWRCDGTDGTYSGSVYNTQSFEVKPSNPNFVPYASLTEAIVVGWLKDALTPEGVKATEDAIAQQIENQVHPKIISPTLPWAASTTHP